MNDFELAVKAAELGGQIVKNHFASPVTSLKGLRDVITNADIEAENAIKKFLLENTDYGFLGEETGSIPGKKVWIVDPIDGTRQFSFGIPHFSTCVALASPKEIEIGVVLNPILNDLFTAQAGKGAYYNNQRIKTPPKKVALDQALIECAMDYSRIELQKLKNSAGLCLVNFSPALGICKTASGRINAAVYSLTDACDHAGASLIASEAGIHLSNFGLPAWDPYGLGIIAAEKNLHEKLLELIPKPLANLDLAEQQHTKTQPAFK